MVYRDKAREREIEIQIDRETESYFVHVFPYAEIRHSTADSENDLIARCVSEERILSDTQFLIDIFRIKNFICREMCIRDS